MSPGPRSLTGYERAAGHGHRGRVRRQPARPAVSQRDAAVGADRQCVRQHPDPGRPGPPRPRGTSKRNRRCAMPAASRLGCAHGPDLAGVHRRRGRRRHGERDPAQRGPALRRPRASRVLDARGHQPARHRPVGQSRRADHGRGGAAGGGHARHQCAHQPLQEQHRQQGCVLRRARELPDEPQRRRSPRSSATSCRSS